MLRTATDLAPTTAGRVSTRVRPAALLACAATVLAPWTVVPIADAASRPYVTWSDSRVRAGTRVVATVEPRSLPSGVSPVLQRKFPDAWRTATSMARRTDRGWELTVPTDQYGRSTYRVVARQRGDVVSRSDRHRVRVETGWDPRGRSTQYAFLYDRRTRWDSCRAVRWTFSDSLAPSHGLAQVKEAVRRLHAATGLQFDYRGKTDHKSNPYGDDVAGADIVVGWRSSRTFQSYVGSPTVVGLAGQRFVTGYRDSDGAVSKTQQAGVILNADHHLHRGFGTGTTWGEVILHELGHVVGLDHSTSRKQVMYYSTTPYSANLGAGDLRGMRQLGNTRGCLHRTSARPTAGSSLTP